MNRYFTHQIGIWEGHGIIGHCSLCECKTDGTFHEIRRTGSYGRPFQYDYCPTCWAAHQAELAAGLQPDTCIIFARAVTGYCLSGVRIPQIRVR